MVRSLPHCVAQKSISAQHRRSAVAANPTNPSLNGLRPKGAFLHLQRRPLCRTPCDLAAARPPPCWHCCVEPTTNWQRRAASAPFVWRARRRINAQSSGIPGRLVGLHTYEFSQCKNQGIEPHARNSCHCSGRSDYCVGLLGCFFSSGHGRRTRPDHGSCLGTATLCVCISF